MAPTSFIDSLSSSPPSVFFTSRSLSRESTDVSTTRARCIQAISGDLMTLVFVVCFRSTLKGSREHRFAYDACGRKCRIRSGNEVVADATDVPVMCDADQQHYVARNRIYNTLYNMRISPNICSAAGNSHRRGPRKLHDIPLLCA